LATPLIRRGPAYPSDYFLALQSAGRECTNYWLMPFVTLQELPIREIFPGFNGRFVHSGFITFVHWEIAAGALLPAHSHPHEQVVNMLEGEFELTIDQETRRLLPGSVAIIPPHARHSGQAITACRIIDAFYPIREDYR